MVKLTRILALPLVLILASAGSGSEAVKALAAGEPTILRVWNWEDYIGVIEVDGEEIPLDEYFEQYVKEVDGVDIDVIYETFDTNAPSEAVEVDFADEGVTWRYYAAAIDADTMAVVEQNPAELVELVNSTASAAAVLGGVSVGQSGYVFSVSGRDYLVTYHPNSAYVGVDALDAGIDVSDLENGNFTWMEFEGERLFCGVSEIDGTYYISAVPESEMTASRNLTVGVILFGKFLIRQQNTFFLFDAIGLALFTVVGVEKTLALDFPLWVAIIMGTITGAAGGVIRDVFINEVPLIFRKEIYAIACVVGGLVYGLCLKLGLGLVLTEIASGVSVLLARILAVKYHWALPVLKGDDGQTGMPL